MVGEFSHQSAPLLLLPIRLCRWLPHPSPLLFPVGWLHWWEASALTSLQHFCCPRSDYVDHSPHPSPLLFLVGWLHWWEASGLTTAPLFLPLIRLCRSLPTPVPTALSSRVATLMEDECSHQSAPLLLPLIRLCRSPTHPSPLLFAVRWTSSFSLALDSRLLLRKRSHPQNGRRNGHGCGLPIQMIP